MTREEAWNLLTEFNRESFHLHHAEVVEGLMKYFAVQEGFADDAEFWGIVGLLHDLDFEQFPQEHCVKEQEIMRERNVDERIVHACASHGYGIVDMVPEPTHRMEKILFAVDELTGIIQAYARMRPEGIHNMAAKGVMKRFKDKRFAAGCDREVIKQGCDMLGMELRDVAEICVRGMEEYAAEIELDGEPEA